MQAAKIHKMVIVGGGPGGLTAGLYASRARMDTLLIEKGAAGGQVLVTNWIDNYPGFPDGISGMELAEKMEAQALRFGLKTRTANVSSMELLGEVKKVILEDSEEILSQTVVIATGARPNKLNIPGEKELVGKGVSFCATCDGPFFRDMNIAVIGGGDTAIQEAVYLTKFAKKVTVIHRRDQLRASKIIQERAFAHEQVDFLFDSEVIAVEGEREVEALQVRNRNGTVTRMAFEGVFVLVGILPNNDALPLDQLANEEGFVVTDCLMRTSIPGVMAIGDIRHNSVRQVVSAASDGAVAGMSIEHYLESM